jgi:putative endonuclease
MGKLPLPPKITTYKASLTWRGPITFTFVFYVYVLRSESDRGFYVGFTINLRQRLKQHNARTSFATAHRGPWKLIYYEAYLNEKDAIGRERYLKSGAGRRFMKAQLRNYLAETVVEETA